MSLAEHAPKRHGLSRRAVIIGLSSLGVLSAAGGGIAIGRATAGLSLPGSGQPDQSQPRSAGFPKDTAQAAVQPKGTPSPAATEDPGAAIRQQWENYQATATAQANVAPSPIATQASTATPYSFEFPTEVPSSPTSVPSRNPIPKSTTTPRPATSTPEPANIPSEQWNDYSGPQFSIKYPNGFNIEYMDSDPDKKNYPDFGFEDDQGLGHLSCVFAEDKESGLKTRMVVYVNPTAFDLSSLTNKQFEQYVRSVDSALVVILKETSSTKQNQVLRRTDDPLDNSNILDAFGGNTLERVHEQILGMQGMVFKARVPNPENKPPYDVTGIFLLDNIPSPFAINGKWLNLVMANDPKRSDESLKTFNKFVGSLKPA